ncbi:melanoma antigen recognized by T-cells 1-like [Rhincodon typus]|uniref:melanoma antigen recognized by T-cells 1 n=1 Tax=Rhincodon typus TaxID=259920 RepID=UPI00202E9D0A|nr:melanoma antigen recognized by T-cells 1 [Rhincodon typus]XP_048449425.1 melanoma antigen recognized by T-cells 1 [Rhincodon typus]XP_048449426.1 melanoma antigen recognized by T-cells 1 [Rhincodon typus]XP_048449427.1 melanoma antigen recognized by T-cells 1 [Rhincodon typus]XP_048449428.1 melanoma antigen recognized by T-cells 1 [Rhincodon typus]XP_048449438.1 melanoma antigen recognized by T-cells 1-like [Rhincodon typus]XP_048449439.1 melanoma antigen recognized by T-cells 1-like [Rhin
MPKGDYIMPGSFGGGRGGLYLRSEEAVCIVLLVIILVFLLIIGCWYYKKRNGYLVLQNRHLSNTVVGSLMARHHDSEEGTPLESKSSLHDFTSSNLIPNAPPAYEKNASEQLPPAYSP